MREICGGVEWAHGPLWDEDSETPHILRHIKLTQYEGCVAKEGQ